MEGIKNWKASQGTKNYDVNRDASRLFLGLILQFIEIFLMAFENENHFSGILKGF